MIGVIEDTTTFYYTVIYIYYPDNNSILQSHFILVWPTLRFYENKHILLSIIIFINETGRFP